MLFDDPEWEHEYPASHLGETQFRDGSTRLLFGENSKIIREKRQATTLQHEKPGLIDICEGWHQCRLWEPAEHAIWVPSSCAYIMSRTNPTPEEKSIFLQRHGVTLSDTSKHQRVYFTS